MLNAFNETTYNSHYKFTKTLPSPRFHNFVNIVVKTPDKLIPRCYPHSLRIFPHRILKFERSTLGFGPTGEYIRRPAEKVKNRSTKLHKTADSQETTEAEESDGELSESENPDPEHQEELEDNEENLKKRVEKMLLEGIYKTTTGQAAKECALPVPPRPMALPQILGTNGDRELYHSVYRRNGTWKAATVVPGYWDRCQVRPLYENSKRSILGSNWSAKSRPSQHLLPSQKPKKEFTAAPTLERMDDRNQETLTPAAPAHVRPTPGYGGFVPKLPILSIPTRDPRLTQSSSAATYRYYPNSSELKILEFAYKGPLSKLVTTASPCNPFRKGAAFSDHILLH